MTDLTCTVAANSGNADETDAGTVTITRNWPGAYPTIPYAGICVAVPDIATGDTIDAASWFIWVAQSDTFNHTIYAEDTDNAGVFVAGSGTYTISSRTPTTATVSKSAANVGLGAWYEITGLAAIVQEVIDRPGWSAGNKIAMIMAFVSGAEGVRFDSFGYNNAHAPYLQISYTVGGGAAKKRKLRIGTQQGVQLGF